MRLDPKITFLKGNIFYRFLQGKFEVFILCFCFFWERLYYKKRFQKDYLVLFLCGGDFFSALGPVSIGFFSGSPISFRSMSFLKNFFYPRRGFPKSVGGETIGLLKMVFFSFFLFVGFWFFLGARVVYFFFVYLVISRFFWGFSLV